MIYNSKGKFTKLHPCITVELRLQQGPLSIVLYYHPPSSAPTFDDLEDALVPLTSSQLKSCILLGDFKVARSSLSGG